MQCLSTSKRATVQPPLWSWQSRVDCQLPGEYGACCKRAAEPNRMPAAKPQRGCAKAGFDPSIVMMEEVQNLVLHFKSRKLKVLLPQLRAATNLTLIGFRIAPSAYINPHPPSMHTTKRTTGTSWLAELAAHRKGPRDRRSCCRVKSDSLRATETDPFHRNGFGSLPSSVQ